jgi:hypothetical protein
MSDVSPTEKIRRGLESRSRSRTNPFANSAQIQTTAEGLTALAAEYAALRKNHSTRLQAAKDQIDALGAIHREQVKAYRLRSTIPNSGLPAFEPRSAEDVKRFSEGLRRERIVATNQISAAALAELAPQRQRMAEIRNALAASATVWSPLALCTRKVGSESFNRVFESVRHLPPAALKVYAMANAGDETAVAACVAANDALGDRASFRSADLVAMSPYGQRSNNTLTTILAVTEDHALGLREEKLLSDQTDNHLDKIERGYRHRDEPTGNQNV